MRAFVLVKLGVERGREGFDALQSIANVEEIGSLSGEYDCILSLQAPDTVMLSRIVMNRVRRAPGVERTATLLEAPM